MQDIVEKMQDAINRQRYTADFATIDRRAIARKSDKDLAAWQYGYPDWTPQYRLAEHEWQRRLVVDQVNAVRFAALLSLLGVGLGATIAYWAR